MTRSLYLVFMIVVGASSSRAALHWSTQELHLALAVGTTEIATSFPFRNEGPESVTIMGLRTDCGCTSAETTKLTYAPGETGQVEVLFRPGERLGAHTKTIEARLSDRSTARLQLQIQITDPVSVSARSVSWQKGAPVEERVVDLNTTAEADINEIAVDPLEGDTLVVQVVPVSAGRRYQVRVTPRTTAESFDLSLTLRVRLTSGIERVLYLRAGVP